MQLYAVFPFAIFKFYFMLKGYTLKYIKVIFKVRATEQREIIVVIVS